MTTDAEKEAGEALAALSERVLRERWRAHPTEAASSGFHEFDGVLPDVSQAAFDARVRRSCVPSSPPPRLCRLTLSMLRDASTTRSSSEVCAANCST